MRIGSSLVLVGLLLVHGAGAEPPPSLGRGYQLMYGLDFSSADRVFEEWRAEHPRDPLGPMSAAASLLFAELNRSGILEAQFLTDDTLFTSRKPVAAPPGLRARLDELLNDAERLARSRLRDDPHDADALFAMALVNGLRADYAALIEGRNMAALSYTRQAARFAQTLLQAEPGYADAYLSTGISQYIVGSLIAPFRWVLRLAGFPGDRAEGMKELWVTAERGRFLGPFARTLLAIGVRARARRRPGTRPPRRA